MTRFGRWRTTKLGAFPTVAAFALFMLSVLTGSTLLLLLSGACFGLTVAAYLLRPNVTGLDVAVTGPARAAVGDIVTHRVRVENHSGRATSPVHVTLTLPGFTNATFAVDALLPGGAAVVSTPGEAVRRTIGRHAATLVSSSAPFGLLASQAVGLSQYPVVIHPRPVRPAGVPVGAAAGFADATPVLTRSGLDLHGIRDWRAGDSPRDVHWRSSARRGRLVVVEREEPRENALTMLLVGTPAAPDWEAVIEVAAAATSAAARSGRQVSLIARQAGLTAITTSRPLELLDWFAALGDTELPRREDIERALACNGGSADLYVPRVQHLPPGWWEWLAAGVAAHHSRSLPAHAPHGTQAQGHAQDTAAP